MSATSVFWLVLYGIATLTFFSVASVITFYGIKDLRSLLSKANRRDIEKKDDGNSNLAGPVPRRGSS